jgi:lysophospholipase L1-like esterase
MINIQMVSKKPENRTLRQALIPMVVLLISLPILAQDPLRFKDEVNQLIAGDSTVNKKKLILFVGSSSIGFWKSLGNDFQKYNTLNRGFGGSEMSDLVFYADKLIVPYRPKQIFIYEGDNDLSNGKNPDEIVKLPRKTQVYFISPKPSIARWSLKAKYEELNQKLNLFAKKNKHVTFIDVWTSMLGPDGTVMKDIFIDDGLHMNTKGYGIWVRVIGPYLK